MNARERTRRALRMLLRVTLILLAVTVVLVVALLTPPSRRWMLQEVLVRASDALPGELAVESARWPALSRLEFEGLRWTSGTDTLAAAGLISVDVDLGALLSKDLHVRELRLLGGRADLPRLTGSFAKTEPEEPVADDGGGPAFPRAGAIPGVPSIGVDSLEIRVDRLVVAEGSALGGELAGRVELRRDRPPDLRIARLEASWPGKGYSAHSDGLRLDPRTGDMGGALDVTLSEELRFRIEAEATDSRTFGLSVRPQSGARVPRLDAGGSFVREGTGPVDSLRFTATLELPDAGTIGRLLERSDELEPAAFLGEPRLEAEGWLALQGGFAAGATLVLSGSEWDGQLRAEVDRSGEVTHLTALQLTAEGLDLEASGRLDGTRYVATAQAEVDDPAFLAPFVDPGTVPADLRASLRVDVEGEGPRLEAVVLDVTGAAVSSGLDSLELHVDGLVDGPETELDFAVRAQSTAGIALALEGRARDLEAPVIALRPLRLQSRLEELGSSDAETGSGGEVHIDPDRGAVEVRGLILTGMAGEVRADADLSRDSGGQYAIAIRWPEPPALLGRAGMDAALRDSLLAPYWGEPRVDLRGEIGAGLGGGRAEVDIALPAPWLFVPALPDSMRGKMTDPLLGHVEARYDRDASAWSADLDFASTAWLDSAFVHLRGEGPATTLDSLLVTGGPLRLTSFASLDSNLVDGQVGFSLRSDDSFAWLLPEGMRFDTKLKAGVRGPVAAPDARLELVAAAQGPGFAVPVARVEAEFVEGLLQSAAAELPEAFTVGSMNLDRARFQLRPEDPSASLVPGWASVELLGELEWIQIARIDSVGGVWTVRTDSLAVGLPGQHLVSRGPFSFRFAPADSTMLLEGLELAGAPGELSASLELGPSRNRADLELHLDPALPAFLLQTSPTALPSRTHLSMHGSESEFEATLRFENFKAGPRQEVGARFDAKSAGNTLEVDIDARDPAGVLARGELVLPMLVDLRERRFEWQNGPLRGRVTVDSLPVPLGAIRTGAFRRLMVGNTSRQSPLIDAALTVSGTGRRPAAGLQLEVGFDGIDGMEEDRLELFAAWLLPEARTDSLALFPDAAMAERMARELPQGGVAVRGSLYRKQAEIVLLEGDLPRDPDAASPVPTLDGDTQLRVVLDAEDLRLAAFNELLPPGLELDGALTLQLRADGRLAELPLDGLLTLDKARFQQSFGSSATVNGRVELSGTSAAPVVSGRLSVPTALIRLPEKGRELHPLEGQAFLWAEQTMQHGNFAPADTLDVDWAWVFAPRDSAEVEASKERSVLVSVAEAGKVDVTLDIPNSFWIRGQGLEIQLAGDLQLEIRDGLPRVVGELRAVGGTFEIVGSRLRLERGTVTFYGEDATNPGLDLELSQKRGDVRVSVLVTGNAREPKLEFLSDPPMSQTDIMSYLLFGSSSSNLDGAQTQLLQDQAAAALSQFAAPMMENELTQSLGISMMQLQAGDDPEDGLSLVVGKYVTPQVLLKYEQSLKDRQKYTVNLEYWLSQNFRVETRLSDSRSSGIKLNWGRDY